VNQKTGLKKLKKDSIEIANRNSVGLKAENERAGELQQGSVTVALRTVQNGPIDMNGPR